jgi:hypothetical protein
MEKAQNIKENGPRRLFGPAWPISTAWPRGFRVHAPARPRARPSFRACAGPSEGAAQPPRTAQSAFARVPARSFSAVHRDRRQADEIARYKNPVGRNPNPNSFSSLSPRKIRPTRSSSATENLARPRERETAPSAAAGRPREKRHLC